MRPTRVRRFNTLAWCSSQSCTDCADACLGENDPESLSRCMRLNLDYADVCDATGRFVFRQIAFEAEMATAALRACAEACGLCGQECELHASHPQHCLVCAEACRRCERACNNVRSDIPA